MKRIRVDLSDELYETLFWITTTHGSTVRQFIGESIQKRMEHLLRLGAASEGLSSDDDPRPPNSN